MDKTHRQSRTLSLPPARLEVEVKQKDMKTFIPGAGKQGDISGLQSAVNCNNFGNKLPSHPPF